jgi:hypothetical protein
VAGSFDEIDATTVIERQAVGLAQIRGVVRIVYGGPGNMLQSHMLCWDNRDATISSRVPSVVNREQFQLILAGPMTPAQELVLAKRHECDGERVHQMHQLLRRINTLYADIESNPEFDADLSGATGTCVRLGSDEDTERLITQARARQATVARMNEEGEMSGEQECTIVESETVLMDTNTDRTEQDRLQRAFTNVTSQTNVYVARRSTELLSRNDPSYLERLFPHLLTFGIGGFGMSRRHRYSERKIVLHYLNHSSNRFAEDSLFKLAMFDYLATARVKSSVFLRVGQDPSLPNTVMRVTPAELKQQCGIAKSSVRRGSTGELLFPVSRRMMQRKRSSLSRLPLPKCGGATRKGRASQERSTR